MKKLIKKIKTLCLVLSLGILFSAPVYSTSYLPSLPSWLGGGSKVEDNDNKNSDTLVGNDHSPSPTVQNNQRNHGLLYSLLGDNIDAKPMLDAGTEAFKKVNVLLNTFFGIEQSKLLKDWTDEDYEEVREKVANLKLKEKWEKDVKPVLEKFKDPLTKISTAADGIKDAAGTTKNAFKKVENTADEISGVIPYVKVGTGCFAVFIVIKTVYMLAELNHLTKGTKKPKKRTKNLGRFDEE